jgi:hypothetical protein
MNGASSLIVITILVIAISSISAFTTGATATMPQLVRISCNQCASSSRNDATQLYGYVPDGLTKEQYDRVKKADAKKTKGKNLGAVGPFGFKSRSIQGWQKAHEKGLAPHVFAPLGYRSKVKDGSMKKADVPYMVRGGAWDNSDIWRSWRLPWMKEDVAYSHGGSKKEQSVSILGFGPGLDWTGKRPRSEKNRKSGAGFN